MQIFPDCGCGCKGKVQEKKFIRALVLGVLFFIVANPDTFALMRKVFGYRVASVTGYPSLLGLLLHALVFFLISWGLMNIPGREKMEGDAPAWATETSNVSPDGTPGTNWSPTDSTGGKPPASIAGNTPAEPSKTLPAMTPMDQPYAEIGMPNTPAQPMDQDSWSRMGANLGGIDINASGALATSGGEWQACRFPNGKQVMLMN